jgi:hypothetical protein
VAESGQSRGGGGSDSGTSMAPVMGDGNREGEEVSRGEQHCEERRGGR